MSLNPSGAEGALYVVEGVSGVYFDRRFNLCLNCILFAVLISVVAFALIESDERAAVERYHETCVSIVERQQAGRK